MPLRDHFRQPLSVTHSFSGFHSAWASEIAFALNSGALPAGFYAVPQIRRDGPQEIDVSTLREGTAENPAPDAGPLAWDAPAPSLVAVADLPPVEEVSVHVLADTGEPTLVASIELVSPGNKDRDTKRSGFVARCVAHLEAGTSVVVVDVVTNRRADLNGAILEAIRVDAGGVLPAGLSAVSYQTAPAAPEGREVRVWPFALAVGEPSPRVPLWLSSEFSISLDLERDHQAVSAKLRVRPAP